jgi:hypothetical protein
MIDAILKTQLLFQLPDRLTDVTSWHAHTPFAFWCVEALRPRLIVELGTHRGDSYSAFCQAVERLRLPTRCYAVDTWRGDPQAGGYGEEVFEEFRAYHDPRYGRFSRLVRTTFDEAAGHFEDRSVDLLHVDGYHGYEAVRNDLETWIPKLSPSAVVLFHDVNVREGDFGVWRLWEEVSAEHPSFAFDHGHGLGVLLWGPEPPEAARQLASSGPEEVVAIRELFSRLGAAAAAQGRLRVCEAQRREAEEALRSVEAAARDREAHLAAEVSRLASAHATADASREALAELQRRVQALGDVQRRLVDELHTVLARRGRTAGQRLAGVPRRLAHAARVFSLLVYWALTLQLRAGLRRRRDARMIRRERVFDASHYLSQLPGSSAARRDPVDHYLRSGAAAGLDPHPCFDTSWYLQHHPDVARSGENPLVHYLRAGAREGLATSPQFDTAAYLARNPELCGSDLNPLAHYLHHGAAQGAHRARLELADGASWRRG